MSRAYKIGDLARQFNVPVETIRYYERAALLPPTTRTVANYRVYGEPHLEAMSFIRRCRSLDMTLAEIRQLLQFKNEPAESCAEVNAMLDEHIGHVAERIAELRRLKSQLETLRETCNDVRSVKDCEILHGLSAGSTEDAGASSRRGHVSGSHRR
jgi:Cd(II)/Pb(II)-responsive transcriptional regulator